jgi:hypothetical protein
VTIDRQISEYDNCDNPDAIPADYPTLGVEQDVIAVAVEQDRIPLLPKPSKEGQVRQYPASSS